MNKTMTSPWFPPCRPGSAQAAAILPGAPRLFCLPHAGAGASAYRDWLGLLAPEVEVVPVQLPGRESRHRDPLRRSVQALVAELVEPVMSRAGGEFALLGHSMGALLGYELAHALSERGCPPSHLAVSGFRAPHLPPSTPRAYDLPDDELIAVLTVLEGTPSEVLAQPELLQLALPVLRADLEVCQTYAHPTRPPLTVPVTAFCGQQDPGVSAAEMRAWCHLTAADFHAELLPGGHFFLHEQRDQIIGVLKARLAGGPAGLKGVSQTRTYP